MNPKMEAYNTEQRERRTRAEAIATLGSYPRMMEEFAGEPGLLEAMIDDLKQRETLLVVEAPYLSEGEWRLLTCLELFDRATFEHCERTWGLAKEKLESTAAVGIYFREQLAAEGLTVEHVLRACLLHDCGKMCLDRAVLNDAHTDGEWEMVNEKFCTRVYGAELGGEKVVELQKYTGEHPSHRAIHRVPYEALAELGEREREHVEVLRANGVNVALSLAELIATHQEHSREMLNVENPDDPAALLVAHHHPTGSQEDGKYKTGLSVLRAGMTLATEMGHAVDILRLSDIYDAYHNVRVYKPGHPSLAAYEYLLKESDRGVIKTAVAEAWVKDSIAHLDREEYFTSLAEYVEQEELTRSPEDMFKITQLFEEEQVAHEKLCARGIIEDGCVLSAVPMM
jgi:hypothetical protein